MLGITTNAASADAFLVNFEDAIPEGALFFRETPDGLTSFTPTTKAINNNTVLQLSDDLAFSEGGASTISIVNPVEIFGDVKVSALVNPTGDTNDQFLLFARLNLETFDAYVAGVDFATNRLFLNKVVDGDVPVNPIVEASDVLPDLHQPYIAEFSVIGNELTARLFDETGIEQLFKLSTVDTDNPLLAGATGISVDISDRAFPNLDDPISGTIDNFAAEPVPEPSSMLGLLAAGALAVKGLQRRASSEKLS
ncbi:MAG: PEP-CTERM sorting domain-containing protein [Leptolyngbya sp. SIO3F4]|nr:PEP-CTERM sorting domain-containing protein [Leptolyngbya sp. SIO3F4]